jgi:hypothetical protein
VIRKARIDSNQPEIVKAFRDLGWIVAHTHTVGQGFPDVVISKAGYTGLVEIKDGNKVASKKKLTKAEKEFHDSWQGNIHIIESVDDVFSLHRSIFIEI